MGPHTPTFDDLKCLNSWPEGSVGEYNEELLIKSLLVLMENHGFGRVHQLAGDIREIWYNNDLKHEYEKTVSYTHLTLPTTPYV